MKLSEIIEKPCSGEWGTDDKSGNGIPVLRTTNFTNEGVINYLNVCTRTIDKTKAAKKFLRHGDIIIEKSGGSDKQPVGRVVYFEEEDDKYLFNNFTAALRVKNQSEWEPKYVFYALFNSYLCGRTRLYQNKTTGLHNLQLSHYVEDVIIPDTPLETQREIAYNLDKVAEAVGLCQKILERLDFLVKVKFTEMFGDPVTNPMGWEKTTIKNISVGKLTYGSGTSAKDYDGEVRYIRITDITDTGELNDSIKSPEQFDDKYLLHAGDILFARSGATVGKTFCYNEETHGKAIYAGYLIRVIPDVSKVIPIFVYHYTKASYYESFIKQAQRVVAQPNINAQEYGNFMIYLPPLPLQEQFAEYVKKIDFAKSAVKKALEKAETLKSALMQKYFG